MYLHVFPFITRVCYLNFSLLLINLQNATYVRNHLGMFRLNIGNKRSSLVLN